MSFASAHDAGRMPGSYLGAMIVVSCAACLTPLEIFLVELWPLHGFASLLLVAAPLAAGWGIARRLPDAYYKTRRVESSGRVYEAIGIRVFKRFVPNGDYINRVIRRADPGYRVVRDVPSVVTFEGATRWAERSHLVSLMMVLPAAVYAVILGWDKFALWLTLPNIPFHLYPVLLQRYTRARIQRVIAKQTRRQPEPSLVD